MPAPGGHLPISVDTRGNGSCVRAPPVVSCQEEPDGGDAAAVTVSVGPVASKPS